MSAGLQLRDLRITSATGHPLVDGVTLDLQAGEAVAIVGESGSGKSLTARAIAGLLPPGVQAHGSITLDGDELVGASEARWRELRGRRITMLPQDPFTMLSPLRRVADQIRDGSRKRLSDADVVHRLAEVGVSDAGVARRFPFELSGGLRQRVGIAAALAGDPEVLLADEPSTALDVTTQRRVLRLLVELRRSRDLALVLITHDLRVAFAMSDRVVVLYAGAQLELAPSKVLELGSLHPYTRGLLACEPAVEQRLTILSGIPGSVPRAQDVEGRCAFADRCEHRQERCTAERPALRVLDPGHATACVRAEELRATLAAGPPAASASRVVGPGSEEPPALVVRGVERTFSARRGGGEVWALRGVSLTVGAHEAVGVVGESGCGKSTLARIVAGLERADAGDVQIAGAAGGEAPRLGGAGRAGPVQVVFQDPSSTLNPSRTVGAILGDALRAGGRDPSASAVRDLLSEVHLPEVYAQRKPVALSGGERQRVAIARAIAPGPRLLVCDEPVSALDVSVQAQILELLRDLQARLGVALLFITHDLGVVRQVADRLYVLREGRVVESGDIEQVLGRPSDPYTRELIDSVPRAGGDWLAPEPVGAAT